MTRRAVSTSSCSARRDDRGCCAAAPDSFASLQGIIDDYQTNYGCRVREEARYFGDKRLSIEEAVRRAARSELKGGHIHDHQRRPGRKVMQRCVTALAGHDEIFTEPRNFAAVHASVERILAPVEGAGELIVYDIAERIGWRLGLEPDEVYLHRGTREGAQMLRPQLRGKTANVTDLPPELGQLSPAHIENLLCIYKAALRSLRDRRLV